MPLSIADAALLNNNITTDLTTVVQRQMPKSKNNSEGAAWRLFLSQRMKSFAEAFNKQAVKDAIAAGVLFNHSKAPKPAGIDEDIYSGDVIRVNVKTKNGSVTLDSKAFLAEAAYELKLSAAQRASLLQLQEKHTKTNAAPHTFTASLKT